MSSWTDFFGNCKNTDRFQAAPAVSQINIALNEVKQGEHEGEKNVFYLNETAPPKYITGYRHEAAIRLHYVARPRITLLT